MTDKKFWLGSILAICAASFLNAAWAAQSSVLDLSNAEVIVTSSSNTTYRGMTNTNAEGRFVLNGVPAGGINVIIRRNGVVIAQGAGVTMDGNLNEAQELNITVTALPEALKSGPSK